ncbi:MAG: hypothetical protein U9O94_10485, partial [Nanoarchaeota archaeon]|nr:hypothetical protein [Nanoarchaeota archaeon]
MAGKKSNVMTFTIAALTVGFVLFSIMQWFDGFEGLMLTGIIGIIGGAIAYYSIYHSRLEHYIKKGLLWAGALLVIISPFFGFDDIPDDLRP